MPSSWEAIALNDLAVLTIGGDWGKDADFDDPEFVSVLCIRGSEFRNWDSDKGSSASLRKVKKSSLEGRILVKGDILVEISGGGPEQPVGRTVLIDNSVLSFSKETPKICTNFLRLLRTTGNIDSNFLNQYLLFFYRTGKIRDYQGGSNNLRNLRFNDYLEIKIPLPPIYEQHRIVAKIEALFSELDKGIESFKTAREQLKIYRQALLKHAFSGKLTEQWRAENTGNLESAEALLQRIQTERQQRYQQQLKDWEQSKSPPAPLLQRGESGPSTGKENVTAATTPFITTDAVIPPFEKGGLGGISKPKPPKTPPPLTAEELAELPELPEGWVWVQLEALVSGIDQGWSPKCENFPASFEEWGVIKTTAVQHGKFLEEENKSLPTDLKPREQHELKEGDILITRAGPRVRVGVCCLVRKVRNNLMNCDKVYRIRSLEAVCSPDYLEAALNSPRILDDIEKIKSGINDSGVNLNQGAFLRLAIPYCSLTEQEFVLNELDRKLSITAQMDQNIESALQQAEALRQSILKKAFSGQLVPQEPNDEPASVLLERIRAEQTALSAQPKVAKNKRSKP